MNPERALQLLEQDLVKEYDDPRYPANSERIQVLNVAINAINTRIPRLLTKDRVERLDPDLFGCVWIEERKEHRIMPGITVTDEELGTVAVAGSDGYFRSMKDYGETFRCWTNRPEKSQCLATKWETDKPDREKVLKALECCVSTDDESCVACPYNDEGYGACDSMTPFLTDILNLLKEGGQNGKEAH